MKTLIIYFSFTGNNELLAKELSKDLDGDLIKITEPKKRSMFKIMMDMLFNRFPKIDDVNIQWERYDQFILMAPIWNYHIAHPMKSFIKRYEEYLKDFSFITLCSGREMQKEKVMNQLKKLVKFQPKNILEFEILKLPNYKAPENSMYKVTHNDLQNFKQEEAYEWLLKTYTTKKEILS